MLVTRQIDLVVSLQLVPYRAVPSYRLTAGICPIFAHLCVSVYSRSEGEIQAYGSYVYRVCSIVGLCNCNDLVAFWQN